MRGWCELVRGGPERVKCSWWVPWGGARGRSVVEVRVGEWGETTLIVYLGSGGIDIFLWGSMLQDDLDEPQY